LEEQEGETEEEDVVVVVLVGAQGVRAVS